MAFCKLSIFVMWWYTMTVPAARCQDRCVFHLKRENDDFHFDLTRFGGIRTANFIGPDDGLVYSINMELCKMNDRQQECICNGIRGSKLCLIKNKTNEIDIGSKIKEMKLDIKDQLFMSLEGNTICRPGQNYTTDITFVCNKTATIGDKIVYKSGIGECKYIIEMVSVTVCPVDDLDVRKFCEIVVLHGSYKFNLNPLRRLTNNYLVENQNRRFEVNICGRLNNNNNSCGGNITTICDITNVSLPKIYAEGYSKNDQLLYDASSKSVKLIQRDKKNKKGRKIEFDFKCDENISPEKTKPKFLREKHDTNVTYFEVATSTVCLPRMMSCEIFTNMKNFNLKPLHKRVGNMMVTNEKDGGYFYLNVCDYLNGYDEEIPSSCTDGKTSICYVDKSGEGIPVGSTQIGPYIVGNSILLNYIDGMNCKNAVKWSTVINFTCSSDKSQLIHDSTNSTTCTHIFQWKTREACEVLFKRQDQCSVTHPGNSENVYNMTSLKDDSFIVDDYEDGTQFRFSICSPLQTSCNGYLDSSACWSINGMEKNIGMFTDQVVFDNGRIYMSMTGERCVHNGPNSYTTVRFICDFSDSKLIDYEKDLHACTFDFIVYTKHACTPPIKVNCTIEDELGNIYDLHKLTKYDTNYEIPIGYKKTIILNVCHSVINNAYTTDDNIEGVDCQLSSGICLFDSNSLSLDRYKNLGDVNKSPRKVGDMIKLEMGNVFYNGNSVSSVIEFICSSQTKGPELVNDKNYIYTFQWLTPLACPNVGRRKTNSNGKKLPVEVNTTTTNSVLINGLHYSVYVCTQNDNNCLDEYSNGVDQNSKQSGQQIILTVNKEKRKYMLGTNSGFVHDRNKTCKKENIGPEKIVFNFICGFEQQRPKVIGNELCNTKVLVIDPKICVEKLECSVNSYDLTSLKGHYVVHHNGTKYFINLCVPGKDGVGGIMELNGKNYTIGYQTKPPTKSEGNDRIEVVFTKGDYCLNCSFIKMKYSTKIILECDESVILGKAIFVKTKNCCEHKFLWKTSFVCFNSKLIDFDKNSCVVTTTNGQDYLNSNVINMKNILNTTHFYDDAKKNIYVVDFCRPSFCTNVNEKSLKCFRSMSLKYNVYKNQLFVYFRDIDGFTKVKILIECSRSTENLLDAYKVSLTDNGEIIIITYSDVMCKNYSFISATSMTTFKTTNYFDYQLSTKFEYNDINFNNIEKPNLANEKIIVVKKEAENSDNKISTTMEKSSSTSFYSGLTVSMVPVLIFFTWIYRWKLLKKVQKLYHFRYLGRRQEIHEHNYHLL